MTIREIADAVLLDGRPANVVMRLPGIPVDVRDLWEERAGIREYEAGFSRDVAERLAVQDVIQVFK